MTRWARIGRAVAAPLLAVVSYGWLDLLRHLPGPHLALVLPLRANGGGGDVSALTVIVVATATFATLARLVPPRHLRSALLLRPLLYGAFLSTLVALQAGIVEQSRPELAWGRALPLAWPWLAAGCAALGTLVAAPRGATMVERPADGKTPLTEPRALETRAA